MKKFLMTAFVLFLCFVLVACGTQSANSNVSTKINKTIDNMSSTLKDVQSISEEDILITEITPETMTASVALNTPRRGVNSTRQIIEYPNNNSFGYSETNALRNVNTYNPYGKSHNVNSYAGYGETNQTPYNEINQAQYGQYTNGMNPNMYNGMYNNGAYNNGMYGLGYGYNQYNGGIANPYARGISNVNTYGINRSNVNTYRPIEENQVVTNENANLGGQTNNQTSNIDSYNGTKQDNSDYLTYQQSENLSNQFSKLSSLYTVAANVVNVNKAIVAEKNYIFSQVQTVKELTEALAKNEVQLNDSQIAAINGLLENIHSNLNRITLSKNEIRYEVDKVKSLKYNYKEQTEQLSSRYVRLTNCLENRYTYYCNISSCLDQLINTLSAYNNGQTVVNDETTLQNTNQVIDKESTANINETKNTENTTNNTNNVKSETNGTVNENSAPQQTEINKTTNETKNAVPSVDYEQQKMENETAEKIRLQNEKLRQIFQKQQENQNRINPQNEANQTPKSDSNQTTTIDPNQMPTNQNESPTTQNNGLTEHGTQTTAKSETNMMDNSQTNCNNSMADNTQPICNDAMTESTEPICNDAMTETMRTENKTMVDSHSSQLINQEKKTRPEEVKLPLRYYEEKPQEKEPQRTKPYRPPFIKRTFPTTNEEKLTETSIFPFKEPKKNDFLNVYFPPNQDNLKPLNPEEIVNI